jgi:hypothetical protein
VLPLFVIPANARSQATPQGDARTDRALAAARTALDRYKDPVAAVHDGYLSTLACIDYPTPGGHGAMAYKAGAMGVHFLNTGLIGPKLDSTKPQVLIYEPDGQKLRLVAAEWFVPTQLAKTPPTIFGRTLEGPMEGHAPVMPAELHHWDLHVWLWKDNPDGMFSSTNSAMKCPASYAYTFSEASPHMVKP